MRLLLDTHALLWWWSDSPRLPARARAAIADQPDAVYVSVATIWEIAIKIGKGKLELGTVLIEDLRSGKALQPFRELAIGRAHAVESGLVDLAHRDPFDRLLISQARLEGFALVSNERHFDAFGVTRVWA